MNKYYRLRTGRKIIVGKRDEKWAYLIMFVYLFTLAVIAIRFY